MRKEILQLKQQKEKIVDNLLFFEPELKAKSKAETVYKPAYNLKVPDHSGRKQFVAMI